MQYSEQKPANFDVRITKVYWSLHHRRNRWIKIYWSLVHYIDNPILALPRLSNLFVMAIQYRRHNLTIVWPSGVQCTTLITHDEMRKIHEYSAVNFMRCSYTRASKYCSLVWRCVEIFWHPFHTKCEVHKNTIRPLVLCRCASFNDAATSIVHCGPVTDNCISLRDFNNISIILPTFSNCIRCSSMLFYMRIIFQLCAMDSQ